MINFSAPRISLMKRKQEVKDPLAPPPDLAGYWPTAQSVDERQAQQAAEKPIWQKLLSIPDTLLLGPSIRGAIAGFGSESDVNPIEGFLRGTPAKIVDEVGGWFGMDPHLSRDTSMLDIRKAFGDNDASEGIGNFLLNFAGDVALDPTTYINPFGFLSKAGIGKVASAGLTIEQQVQQAIRAPLVFHVPFTDIYADAGSALGMKSMNLTVAKAADSMFSYLRMNPITGPIMQAFGSKPIADPKQYALYKASIRGSKETSNAVQIATMEAFRTLPKQFQSKMLEDKEFGAFMVDLTELGAKRIDDEGQIINLYDNYDRIVADAKLRSLHTNNEQFRNLWNTAAGADVTSNVSGISSKIAAADDASVEAIKKLYEYDVPIPDAWLKRAGLKGRPGIEIHAPETVSEIIGNVPDATTPSEAARFSEDQAATLERTKRSGYREARKQSALNVWRSIQDGSGTKEAIDQFLTVHREAMERIQLAEKAAGIISRTTEFYFPRIRNTRAMDVLDQQFAGGLGNIEGYNAPAFMKQRKFTSMLTTEINMMMDDIGSKATGFKGMKESREAFKARVGADPRGYLMSKLFPTQWVKDHLVDVDRDAADFFLADPYRADIYRTLAGSKKIEVGSIWQALTHPQAGTNYGEAKLGDNDGVMKLIARQAQMGKENGVVPKLGLVNETGSQVGERHIGDVVQEVIGQDIDSRINLAKQQIRDHTNLRVNETANQFDDVILDLKEHQKIGPDSNLDIGKDDPLHVARLKGSIQAQKDAQFGADFRAKIREYHRIMVSGGPISDVDKALIDNKELAAHYGDLRARAKDAVDSFTDAKSFAESTQSQIDFLKQQRQAAVASEGETFAKSWDPLIADAEDRLKALSDQGATSKKPSMNSVMRSLAAGDEADYLAKLNREKQTERSIRTAMRDETSELTEFRNRIIGLDKGAQREGISLLKFYRDKGISPEVVANEARMWWNHKENGHSVWDELDQAVKDRLVAQNKGARLVLMDPEVYAAAQSHVADLKKPDLLRNFPLVRLLDGIKQWWAPMTVVHPAYLQGVLRDGVQGAATMAMTGNMSLAGLLAGNRLSSKIGSALKEGKPFSEVISDEPIMTRMVNGVREALTERQFFEAAQPAGTVGSGFVKDSIADAMSRSKFAQGKAGTTFMDYALGAIGITKPRPGHGVASLFESERNPIFRFGIENHRYVDEAVRTAGALTGWRNGMDLKEALDFANRWSYGTAQEYTSFERHVLKRFIPFYGFSKWSIGRVAESMVDNPKSLSWFEKVRQNAYDANGIDEAELKSSAPKFIADQFGVPYMNTPEGPRFLLFGSLLPQQAVSDFAQALQNFVVPGEKNKFTEGLRYLGRNLHPAVKEMLEMKLNQDFFTGRELQDFPGQHAEMFGISMPKDVIEFSRQIRLLGELDRLNIFNASEFKVAFNAVSRGGAYGSRVELDPLTKILTSAFSPVSPVKAYQIDVAEDTRRQRRMDQDKLNQDKGRLRARLNEPGRPSAKDDVEALQSIITDDLAQLQARRALEASYGVDAAAEQKQRRDQLRARQGIYTQPKKSLLRQR